MRAQSSARIFFFLGRTRARTAAATSDTNRPTSLERRRPKPSKSPNSTPLPLPLISCLPQPNRSAPSQARAPPHHRRCRRRSGTGLPPRRHVRRRRARPPAPPPPRYFSLPPPPPAPSIVAYLHHVPCDAPSNSDSLGFRFTVPRRSRVGLVVRRPWDCAPRAWPAVRCATAVKSRRPARASVAVRGRNVIYAGAA